MSFFSSSIGRLRLAGITEGISFLVLLLIAMPLKYYADMPLAVKYVGWAHGLLFIIYIFCLVDVRSNNNWPIKKVAVAFIASLLPFGTFVLDKQWRKEEKELTA